MKGLNWEVSTKDYKGNAVVYESTLTYNITDTIEFYITYLVHMGNDNEWYFSISQTSPYNNNAPSWIKCYTPEVGMKMAEDEYKTLINGVKNFLKFIEE